MGKIKRLCKNQISIGTSCAVLVALLLSGVSCSNPRGSATSKKALSPPVEVKDPIISMVMASSIDAKGEIVNARFTFPPNEPHLTAIVFLGKINGSQLNMTWYKTSESGDEKLFEHQIQVKSNGRAFSIGKNQGGTLSIGTYKVVATLDGQTKEVEFDVSPAKKKQKSTSNRSDENVFENRSLMQMVAWKSASWQQAPRTPTGITQETSPSPVYGPSGIVLPPPNSPSGPTASICDVSVDGIGGSADSVEILSEGNCLEPYNIKVFASITGAYQFVGTYGAGARVRMYSVYQVDPCWLPGGSDLPGTKVAVKVENVGATRKTVVSANSVITLGEDTLAPRVNVVSTPARGTKVKTGDKIHLNVTAAEKRSGGPWQTGVKVIQVTAEPGGLVKEPWTNPSNLPKSCGEKTWEQKYEATYTVPKDPPAVIKICAITEDYVGNESSQCGEFPTGDLWKGTLHAKSSQFFGLSPLDGSPLQCLDEEWDINLDLVVLSDGSVTGKGDGQLASMPKCSFPEERYDLEGHTISCPGIRGRFDGKEFQLQFPAARPGEQHGTLGGIVSLSGSPPGQNPPTLRVQVIGSDMAKGQTKTDVNIDGPRHATGLFDIALKCANCSK
jgi:hypothetical protein